jgi:hyperosmotically inducible protein
MIQVTRSTLAAAVIAVAAVGLAACASEPEKRQTTGQYMGDAALTAKVKTAIATDAGARTASSINVETHNGVVQLSGFVDNADQKKRATAAAKKVEGVKDVKDDTRIKPAS